MKVIPAVAMAALCSVLLIAFVVPAAADTHVKTASHVNSYYRGGQVIPEEDSVRNVWIGDRRMAYITDGQKILIDLNQNSFTFINRAESTYVETSLPLDMSKVFSEEENARLELFKRQGTVEKNEEPKTIGEWACAAYTLNDWMIYDDSKLQERDIVMWVTTDVPFDCHAFEEMRVALETLGNLGPEYIALRQGIHGFQVSAEETMYTEGVAIKTTLTVTELAEEDPPEDLYAVPEGYEKNEFLTLQDLNS